MLDGFFIFLILLLNSALGFVQEYRAEKALEALKRITVSKVRVVRDGKEQEIDSKFLVPGDVIMLSEGDKIPADGKLIDSVHFEVNEASLTGKSMPVEKKANDEKKRDIFMGTIVAKGRAKAEITSTGMNTCLGKIALKLSQMKEEPTPLAKKLQRLGKQLGLLAILGSLVVFIIGFSLHHPLFEMILTSISLAVASVPEGLPAVVTITLAVGMQRMARQKAIIRKLSAVEALGSATIIATDKTGTLTRNQVEVVRIWLDGESSSVKKELINKHPSSFKKLLTIATVCNNANLIFKHDRKS